MITLDDMITKVLIRLEDSNSSIWSRSEIEQYIKSGYDQLTRTTRCLWDMSYNAEDVTYCGNHNYKWEEDYMTPDSGFLILNVFNFTGGSPSSSPIQWEQQYQDNGIGPCNHTNLWEDDYTSGDIFSATAQLPEHTIEVERVTYDNYRIEPQFSKDLAEHYKYYEYIQGPQRSYTLDKDGYFTIRKVPVPSGKGNSFTFTGTYGIMRGQTNNEFETNPTVIGTYGILRSFPQHFPIGGDMLGTPRRMWSDVKNVRIEYSRRGNSLDDYPLEVPDWYAKFIELYAMSLAREHDGPGQNKDVAAHFMQRYMEGVARLINRKLRALKERVSRMGGGSRQSSWPDLAKYPYPFPSLPPRY